MGAHSGARHLRSLRASIQIRNTGRHSDKPILETDHEPVREHTPGRHRASVLRAVHRAAERPEPEHRHRRSRSWWLIGLSAAAVAVVISVAALLTTRPDTGSGSGTPPFAIGRTPDSTQSPESVPDGSGTVHPSGDPSEPATAREPSPQMHGDPMPSGDAPAPVRPSGSEPVPPAQSAPTHTQTVTRQAAPAPTVTRTVQGPAPEPIRITILKTVRATETVHVPGPRVTVRVTVRVPSLLP